MDQGGRLRKLENCSFSYYQICGYFIHIAFTLHALYKTALFLLDFSADNAVDLTAEVQSWSELPNVITKGDQEIHHNITNSKFNFTFQVTWFL
jgi:hypothetical protein